MSDVQIARNYFPKFKHGELLTYKIDLQWCATLRQSTLRQVFKEIAKICHHQIFHFKAGFTIKFYFDSKFAIQLFKKARDFHSSYRY